MSGFGARIDEIRQTGEAAARAADIVRGVNAGGAWPEGEAGIPGAKAVAKLEAVRHAWQRIQADSASALAEHADSVTSAAGLYASSDHAAREALSTKEAPSGGIAAV
ncbi:hypothetical protein CFN78_09950 [Amycolatopsis antarctica]|uniref:ESX-1 secretion-associated protein n=1 Tax=Amycolatopsis antarctica TaxID=1854586 RepID=A0A263D422_9PSEU|nr:hypothetical protein [Amycolatopsis antarctica]OZM73190.1 hypothetical protein CFN78_09950 [Amycolatopsis antarctica]